MADWKMNGTAGAPIGNSALDAKLNRVGGDGSAVLVTPTGGGTARSMGDRFADVVNVKDYGAKGNWVDNDTAALNAARDAAFASGKAMYLPVGVYLTEGLHLYNGMRLVGANGTGTNVNWIGTNPASASTLMAWSAETNVLEVDCREDGYAAAVEIAYLNVLGAAGSGSIATPIAASYTAWAQSTAYVQGDRRSTAQGDVYGCITGGTSAGTGTGPKGFGYDITDGGVHWEYLGLGNGIYVHGTALSGGLGSSGLHIHHVSVGGCPGRGIHLAMAWFSLVGPMVHVDACAEHAIELAAGNNVKLDTVYVHRVAANKCGYRIHHGYPVLDNCNGIDTSGAGSSVMILGDTVAEDGVQNGCHAVITGANIEAFPLYGLWLKFGSLAVLRACFFLGSQPNAVALRADYTMNGMMIDPTNAFVVMGSGTWLNSQAIHVSNCPVICMGKIQGVWESDSLGHRGYNDADLAAQVMPTLDISGAKLRVTALSIVNGGYLSGSPFANGVGAITAHGVKTFAGVTWSASPIADGAVGTVTVAFSGADTTQRFTAYYSDQYVPAGIIMHAQCSASGQVAITVYNKSGGNYAPPTGTLYVENWVR